MNKVVLIGRLTKDPELRYTAGNNKAVTSITLAVDKFVNGEKQADFVPVVIWNKQAESTAQYMAKGSMMAVSGRIQTRSYEAQDGTKRYITEVVATEVQFLSKSQNDGNSQGYQSYSDQGSQQEFNPDEDITPVDDGDMPF